MKIDSRRFEAAEECSTSVSNETAFHFHLESKVGVTEARHFSALCRTLQLVPDAIRLTALVLTSTTGLQIATGLHRFDVCPGSKSAWMTVDML